MNRQEERRKDYESPCTRMVQVETEGNLCGSVSMEARSPHSANADAQEVNDGFEKDNTFTGANDKWD